MYTNLDKTGALSLLNRVSNTLIIEEGFEIYDFREINDKYHGTQVFLRKGEIDLDVITLYGNHLDLEWTVEAYRRDCDLDVYYITEYSEIPDIVEFCIQPHIDWD